MAYVTYEIVEHDGGWAYKLGETLSETYASRQGAVMGAKVPKYCGIGRLYHDPNPRPKPNLTSGFGKVRLPPASGIKKPAPKPSKPAR